MTWQNRTLGHSGLATGALGLGCWAIGGPFWDNLGPNPGFMGYGNVDEAESLRALDCALALGVRFFDVAGVYGCGQAERLLGQALKQHAGEVILAAKFGYCFDETTKTITGTDLSPAGIQAALEQSLARLGREYLDLYQLHLFDVGLEQALVVAQTLDKLKQAGLIRAYAWCNEQPAMFSAFTQQTQASVVPIMLNILEGQRALPTLCHSLGLGVTVRRPLAMGLLGGKLRAGHEFAANDMRKRFGWNLVDGKQAAQLQQLDALHDLLTVGGRSLAQGALAWLWAFDAHLVPIPGFKTVAQVEEHVGALARGPLPAPTMAEIARLQGMP
jgi:aryl-alcohol dehydrogenase-like predicted oxidoreductase